MSSPWWGAQSPSSNIDLRSPRRVRRGERTVFTAITVAVVGLMVLSGAVHAASLTSVSEGDKEAAGRHEYICTVEGHENMKGTLTVGL